MRKHSDHKNESDEANNMSWLTMLNAGRISLYLSLSWENGKKEQGDLRNANQERSVAKHVLEDAPLGVMKVHMKDMSLIKN